MDITYLGLSSFKISNKRFNIITDPFDPKMVGLAYPKQKADLVTISHDHADHNNISAITDYKKVFDAPGEYEVEGASVIGINSFHDKNKGADRGANTIFIFEIEGLRIAHLGDLGHELKESDLGKLGDIDILMVPVGGEYTINSAEAVKVTSAIEPKIVIPMHYKVTGINEDVFGKLESAEPFLNSLGYKVEHTNKLNISQRDLPEDEQMAVVFG